MERRRGAPVGVAIGGRAFVGVVGREVGIVTGPGGIVGCGVSSPLPGGVV